MREQACQATLPPWQTPQTIDEAKTAILSLGRNLHEHAYAIGKYLAWVKAEVGYGKFVGWLDGNIKTFSQRTTYNFMRFTNVCDKKGKLLPYEPSSFATVAKLEYADESAVLQKAKEIKGERRAERIAEATQEGRKERRAAEGEVRKVLIQEWLAVVYDG